jgi:hypothetical protein
VESFWFDLHYYFFLSSALNFLKFLSEEVYILGGGGDWFFKKIKGTKIRMLILIGKNILRLFYSIRFFKIMSRFLQKWGLRYYKTLLLRHWHCPSHCHCGILLDWGRIWHKIFFWNVDPDPVKVLQICHPGGWYQWQRSPVASGVIDTAHQWSVVSLIPHTTSQRCHWHRRPQKSNLKVKYLGEFESIYTTALPCGSLSQMELFDNKN